MTIKITKAQKELLDKTFVKETIKAIKKHSREAVKYYLLSSFHNILDKFESLEKKRLDKLKEKRAVAIGKVNDRYSSEIEELNNIVFHLRQAERTKTRDTVVVAGAFLNLWLIEQLISGRDLLSETMITLSKEYAKAWIDGWRPPVK